MAEPLSHTTQYTVRRQLRYTFIDLGIICELLNMTPKVQPAEEKNKSIEVYKNVKKTLITIVL